MAEWKYEADLGIDHARDGRIAAGVIGFYDTEAELRAAVAGVLGTTLDDLRKHTRFSEYPDGTDGVPGTTPIAGATLTRYTEELGTDDDWRMNVNL